MNENPHLYLQNYFEEDNGWKVYSRRQSANYYVIVYFLRAEAASGVWGGENLNKNNDENGKNS